jgi:DNA-binding IclR family transcriptional regulator
MGVAAPVQDLNRNVVAALTVVAPSFRFGKERRVFFEKALREKAAYFSKMLGFHAN